MSKTKTEFEKKYPNASTSQIARMVNDANYELQSQLNDIALNNQSLTEQYNSKI
jgi:hypothetical protein